MDSLLIDFLRAPGQTWPLAPVEWESLICQGQAAGLLGKILAVLEASGQLEQVPSAPRRQMEWARVVSESQRRAVCWEVDCLRRALAELEQPFILLKGAAYVMAGLPAAEGRLFGDVDLLVAREELRKVEALLTQQGWYCTTRDAYDQRYYREWMHELPPLKHRERGTVADVHHGLLPVNARLRPDPDLLRRDARPVPGTEGLLILAPADMVLHAACHLFHEGEFQRGLRDLVDLDSLLRNFGPEPGFWTTLRPRAQELNLARPLYYALRYSQRLLATPIPPTVLRDTDADSPPTFLVPLMDCLFLCVLRPELTDRKLIRTSASMLLYLRAHALRMPLRQLIPHLARKSWRALLGKEQESAA